MTTTTPAAPSNGTALAPAAQELKSFLKAPTILKELAKMLPEAAAGRLVQQALSLAFADNNLLSCTPRSILSGIVKAAELNLELSGPLGHCYLVPRWNSRVRAKEATFQVGYKGLIALAFRSNQVGSFQLRTVYEKDLFRVQYGLYPHVAHEPSEEAEPGPARAYYAVVQFRAGGADFEVMTRAQVEAHRLKYSPPPADKADRSAWATNFDEMAQKTVGRRLAKRVPLSVEFQTAAAYDEQGESLGARQHDALEAPASRSDAILEALCAPAECAAGQAEQPQE